MKYSKLLKSRLNDIIVDVSRNSDFIRNPNSDFTRTRKLGFITTFNSILSMGGSSLDREIVELFNYSEKAPTKSAFVQAREKILPSAFSHVFYDFSSSLRRYRKFKNHNVLAVDGSSLITHKNRTDSDAFIVRNKDTKYNEYVVSALYDILNQVYTDAVVQPVRHKDERGALVNMLPNISKKSIVVADRGYESYNVIAHLEHSNSKYVLRVKDIDSNGILSGFHLADEEFDHVITVNVSNFQKKAFKSLPNYRFSPSMARFDFSSVESPVCSLTFRVVRFRLDSGKYQCLITNLLDDFSINDITYLYKMRWGIETSFRQLKYAVGLINLHAKKKDSILQEIYASLTLHNFCESIIQNIVLSRTASKHFYKINFVMAVQVCRKYLRLLNTILFNIEACIRKYLSVIRNDRAFTRNIKHKTCTSFIYRVT